ncbi:MAG: spermidine synthase, partial [Wenzhouxiangellaceae bacterium]
GQGVDILYRSEGLLGQLMVVDLTGEFTGPRNTHRVLFVNRTAQTWIDRDTGQPVWDYVRFINTLASIKSPGSRALVLGLGGGTIAADLQDLGYTVDSVELDARIAEVARHYFGLELNGRLFVDDGRHFLEAGESRYDLILFDVYQAEVPPVHLLTREAFERAARRLSPGGMIVVNYSGYWSGSAGRGARSIFRTLKAAGLEVNLMPTGADEHTRNNLFIASPDPVNFDQTRRALIIGGRQRSVPSQFQPVPPEVLEDALVLVDDRPILDQLNLEPAARWRETYYTYFTKPFRDQGVPLFQ